LGGFEWDEYKPIPEAMHQSLKDELRTELQKPNSTERMGFRYFRHLPPGIFKWEKPGKIETDTPPVQALQTELIRNPSGHGWQMLATGCRHPETLPQYRALLLQVL